MGQINVRDAHRFGFGQNGAHKLASYIAKYCSKEMNARTLDQKRYFRSKGNVLLKVDTFRLLPKTMLGAVQAAHSCWRRPKIDPPGQFSVGVNRHCMDGLQTWCNNALGVVYLATAPGLPDVDYCPF